MPLFQNRWIHFILCQLRDVVIAFGISVVITYLYVGKGLFASVNTVFLSCLYGFIVAITIWKGISVVGYFIGRLFPWKKNPALTLTIHIIAAVIYTAVAIVMVNILFHEIDTSIPLKAQSRHAFVQMVIEMGIAMFITTIFYVREFFVSWRKAVLSGEKYKQEALSLQYETLKSYVNPHFLFNSLSVLSSLVEKDTVKSQLFIKQLSDIYRYVLEQKDKELVSLETELGFAHSFIELHKIRHGENLRVEVQVDDKSGYIIPLSMQILLENAFKHNIISEEEPLEVNVWRDNDYVIVQNRLQARKTIAEAGGIGLETITRRYAFFTAKTLTVSSDNCFFTVRVPVLELSDLPGDK